MSYEISLHTEKEGTDYQTYMGLQMPVKKTESRSLSDIVCKAQSLVQLGEVVSFQTATIEVIM